MQIKEKKSEFSGFFRIVVGVLRLREYTIFRFGTFDLRKLPFRLGAFYPLFHEAPTNGRVNQEAYYLS
jgi:hypothetical protein